MHLSAFPLLLASRAQWLLRAKLALPLLFASLAEGSAPPPRHNVLLIYLDDLRLNVDGTEHTPAQDRLRKQGAFFTRAHAMYPMCGPSRNALLTGRRLDSIRTWTNKDCDPRGYLGDKLVTLPQAFKKAGYHTTSLSKVFHPGCGTDVSHSWTEKPWEPPFVKPFSSTWVGLNSSVPEFESPSLEDGLTAAKANATLTSLSAGAKRGTPFFLAVGMRKPHLPWIFPERFLDLHPVASVPLAKNPFAPKHSPSCAEFTYPGMKSFGDMKKLCKCEGCSGTHACSPYVGPIPDWKAIELRRAYHAAASWTDFLVGGLLAKLDELGMTNNTVIAYVSDHGWKLGEHASWEKNTLWRDSVLTPFIISLPGLTTGSVHSDLVEHIDLAPTLAEICGVPLPAGSHKAWEGVSLLPVLRGDANAKTKNATFASATHGKGEADLPAALHNHAVHGSSITTDRWKLVEWPLWDKSGACPQRVWDQSAGRELYDLDADPHENKNVAGLPEHAGKVAHLSGELRKHFKHMPCERPPQQEPGPADGCAAQVASACGSIAQQGYGECHDCCWESHGSFDQCDWGGNHSSIISDFCGEPSTVFTYV